MVKRNFVVVASQAEVREALASDLTARGYSVTRATGGADCERVVRSVAVDAVLIESDLADLSPRTLRERILRHRPECRVIVFTARHEDARYLVQPDQLVELAEAPFRVPQDGSGDGPFERGQRALTQVIDTLVGLLELDQRHFGGFSHQAMRHAREVALELGVDETTVQEVVLGTLLRDVGRVNVEPDLLDAPGGYSDEQKEQMKAHVDGSVRLFEHVDFPWKVLPVIRHHHERFDGAGHPDGLKGRAIPLGARIVAVVDAYVALTSGRNHRGAFEPEEALRKLIIESGRQFDPEVVEALQRVLDRDLRHMKSEKSEILVVGADPESLKPLEVRLVNEGHEVRCVDDLEQALHEVLERAPHLMAIDLDRDRDGAFQLLGELREDDALCKLPVVFLTGSRDRITRLRALREGIDEYLHREDPLDEVVARLSGVLARESLRREGAPRRRRRGITGDLEHLSLAEIVQTLAMGMKTARITLRGNGDKGMIWFENGQLRHAKCGKRQGEEAFYELVRWTVGEFVIQHGVRTRTRSIEQDAMFLVMEGLRRLDEEGVDPAKAAS